MVARIFKLAARAAAKAPICERCEVTIQASGEIKRSRVYVVRNETIREMGGYDVTVPEPYALFPEGYLLEGLASNDILIIDGEEQVWYLINPQDYGACQVRARMSETPV